MPGTRRTASWRSSTSRPCHALGYLVGVDGGADWQEIANSDASAYGGSGVGNMGRAVALAVPAHGRSHSLSLSLPPLGALFLKPLPMPEPLEMAAAAAAAAEAAEADVFEIEEEPVLA